MSLRIIRVCDLDRYLMKENVYLVDVRGQADFAKYHIDGALCVPEDRLENFLKAKGMQPLYILCCERGITSVRIGKELDKRGYRVGTLAGGITAYKKSH